MKISPSLRELHRRLRENAQPLSDFCRNRLSGHEPRWHYESRIKEILSFALKVETGRVRDASSLEDFFACTIVVPSYSDVQRAVALVEEHFVIKERRPKADGHTHKRPSAFDFDDLRLYVQVKEGSSYHVDQRIRGILFEVQIKTFLQHAWSIATHDLVYKSKSISWPLERVAFQVKAMLEHAELVISEADTISESGLLKKVDSQTERISKIIDVISAHWAENSLPGDVRRVASNFEALLRSLKIDIMKLDPILVTGKLACNGEHPTNLSPYGALVKYIFTQKSAVIMDYISRAPAKGSVHVVITSSFEGAEDVINAADKFPGLVYVG